MDPLSFFSGIILALIGIGGVTWNNSRNAKKEEELARIAYERDGATRLLSQKHAAFAELLGRTLGFGAALNSSTKEEHEAGKKDALSFWSAVEQAKLVSRPSTAVLIEKYSQAFYTSYGQKGGTEKKAMLAAFSEELGT